MIIQNHQLTPEQLLRSAQNPQTPSVLVALLKYQTDLPQNKEAIDLITAYHDKKVRKAIIDKMGEWKEAYPELCEELNSHFTIEAENEEKTKKELVENATRTIEALGVNRIILSDPTI